MRLLLLLFAAPALGQTATLRSIEVLGDQATDQHGATFTVGGLSGVDLALGGPLWAVQDNSDHLVQVMFDLDADGGLSAVGLGAGLQVADTRDFEAAALAADGSLWLCEEGAPSVRRYDAQSGALLEVLPAPPVFAARRNNRGFESLALACDQACLWTANEEALTVDGPTATPTNGSAVRLLRYDLAAGAPSAAEQFAYLVEPMHGSFFPGGEGQSGLVDLVALPDGRLLALERALALANPVLLSRLFLVEVAGATDVSGFAALDGATYTPVTKTLLWQGSAANLEGLCLGPQLTGGGRALLGVIDDGDPLSLNALVSFELTGVEEGACVCTPGVYCSTSPNSAGSGARIGWSGSTSLAQNDLALTAGAGPPGAFGLFVHGPERANVALGDGRLCLGGALVRFPVVQLDGAGSASQLVDAAAFAVGEAQRFQLWYRDAGFGAAGFNLSDALEARFCP